MKVFIKLYLFQKENNRYVLLSFFPFFIKILCKINWKADVNNLRNKEITIQQVINNPITAIKDKIITPLSCK